MDSPAPSHADSRARSRLLALAVALIPVTGFAQGYVGFGAGVSHLNISCTGSGIRCDENGEGYKVFAGYQFNRGFALEALAVRFGDAFTESSGQKTNFTTSGAGLAAVGIVHMSPNVVGMGRVGLMVNSTAVKEPLASEKTTSVASPMIGLGIGFRLTDAMMLRIEALASSARYTASNGTQRAGVQLYSADLSWSF